MLSASNSWRARPNIRRAVKREHQLPSTAPLHAGVVAVVQRFRSDLGLYVHLHCLVTDGAFEERAGELLFRPAPPPTRARMLAVLTRVREAIAAAADDDDELDLDPALAACVQRSLRGPHLAALAPDAEPPPQTLSAHGLHLHAATTVDGRDRGRLERVCRYLLRPPFAHDAVEATADGRVRVHFKAPWRRGAAFAEMTVDTFLSRLCALVPPPRFHMTRYYGVFASHHRLRARVIPSPPQPPAPGQLSLCLAPGLPEGHREAAPGPRRIGWAKLLARVFAVDVTVCSKCGGRMKIVEVVSDPQALAELVHGARAPPRSSRAGQLGLFG
ncbi:MAG: transposase [Nannocystis sp.]|nr:transposase [Nannocystis sp.]